MTAIQFEARLMGLKKTRNAKGDWCECRLEVHPDEAQALFMLKLGTRLGVAAVPIGDDEQPITPEKPKGGELARRAGILCSDKRFWHFCGAKGLTRPDDTREAASIVRGYCEVGSRAELDGNPQAASLFLALEQEFKLAHGMTAEKR